MVGPVIRSLLLDRMSIQLQFTLGNTEPIMYYRYLLIFISDFVFQSSTQLKISLCFHFFGIFFIACYIVFKILTHFYFFWHFACLSKYDIIYLRYITSMIHMSCRGNSAQHYVTICHCFYSSVYCQTKVLFFLTMRNKLCTVPDLPIGSIGWSLGPHNLGGIRSRCMIF